MKIHPFKESKRIDPDALIKVYKKFSNGPKNKIWTRYELLGHKSTCKYITTHLRVLVSLGVIEKIDHFYGNNPRFVMNGWRIKR